MSARVQSRVAGLVLAVGLAIAGAPEPARGELQAGPVYRAVPSGMNQIGLTVTNYGFFGNNFTSRAPSFEFPLGSGYEHMARGGLWVGAHAFDTNRGVFFHGVSAAVVDNAQGQGGASETEFTPAADEIVRLSRITTSQVYSPAAVSDEDLISVYRDQPEKPSSGYQSEPHTPLQILVRQRALSFSLEAADAFLAVRFTIVNEGPPLRDVYVGLYAQLVSGSKNAYPTWPPSASSGPGSWYYNTYAEYDSTRRLYKERFCRGLPMPGSCDLAYCPPWAGVKLLGATPGELAGRTVGLHWWSYSPGDTARSTDERRYRILADGSHEDPRGCVPGTGCSPIMVLSVGPFAQILAGDSITVDYAFVGGTGDPGVLTATDAALLTHADFAQFAYDIGYRLPAPPPSPRVHLVTGERSVDIYWDDSPESTSDPTSQMPGGLDFEGYRVYLSSDRQVLARVAQYDVVDTTGFNTGLEPALAPTPLSADGRTYRYRHRIEGLRDGFAYWGAVRSYDTGDSQTPSLESGISQNKFMVVPNPAPGERAGGVTVYPNPYRVEARWDRGTQVRDHYLWFANLPKNCVLSIYTLSGDLVFATRFEGATYHGGGARGLYDPVQDRDTPPPTLSGSAYAWNLITRHGQAAATGLYLYSVQDLDGGPAVQGKFLIVKSDRESF